MDAETLRYNENHAWVKPGDQKRIPALAWPSPHTGIHFSVGASTPTWAP